MSEASSMTLRQRLAQLHSCEPAEVGPWAVLQCVSPWKRPQYRLARWLHPKAFAQDVSVVEDALNATRPEEVKLAITDLHDRARRRPLFWRASLGWRVSGRRLLTLALSGCQGVRSK
ncbi:MAG: hypothetical protein ACKOKG_04320 [Verrucomicrobiota bacterium]